MENRLTLKQAASRLRVTYGTVLRWIRRGYPIRTDGANRLVHLESLRIGAKVETSVQAIDRFIEAIS